MSVTCEAKGGGSEPYLGITTRNKFGCCSSLFFADSVEISDICGGAWSIQRSGQTEDSHTGTE